MGASFDYDLNDLRDDTSFAKGTGRNHINFTPDGSVKPLRTSGSVDTEPQRSISTWSYSDILQGSANVRPQGAIYDVFNQTLSNDLAQILTENGGADGLLGGRKEFAPYDVVQAAGNGSNTSTQGAVDQALAEGAGTTAGSGPIQAESPDGPITVVTVRGIQVNQEISGQLDQMLAAAEADGVQLSGWGWRSHQKQIELRTTNGCPDVWTARPSTCRVPTAIPGTSRHEYGKAIDFTQGGNTLSRSTTGYNWLVGNAAKYGFKNLPSEAWHWSTDGK